MTERVPPPAPAVDTPESAGFWEAAARRELVACRCDACDRWFALPLAACAACGGPTAWVRVRGEGRVVSWTVVERQTHPAFPVPYTILLVELVESPDLLMVGSVPGRPAVRDGAPVRVRFDERRGGRVVPGWDLV